jgi:type VI secretion system secreted protein Hcp
MANLYMRIDGLTSIKGSATLEEIGGKKGFMPIDSAQFGVGRSINISVGAATSGEMGTVNFADISVARGSDGASPYLQTFFFAPSDSGKTVEIVVTKADRTGEGLVPSMLITMEEARMSSYSLTANNGATDNFSLAYTKVSIAHYIEEADGTIQKSDTVTFDLKTAKLVSKAAL